MTNILAKVSTKRGDGYTDKSYFMQLKVQSPDQFTVWQILARCHMTPTWCHLTPTGVT